MDTSFNSPFLTYTNSSEQSGYMGWEEELHALHMRTEALDNALRDPQYFDVLLDMLDEQGQDVGEYLDEVEDQIELVIASHIVPSDLAIWQGLR